MASHTRMNGLVAAGLAACAVLTGMSAALNADTPSAAMPAAPAPPVNPAEVEGLIFERQQIMLQLDEDAEQLGLIVAGLAPRARLGPVARAIANGAKDAEASFALTVPGGRSKPEVWSNRADYDRLMKDFVTRSDAMAKLAEADNLNGVIESLGDALPCKQCHDSYRTPKKPG